MTEREIFTAALHQPEGPAREVYLAAACAGDSALRQRVESLLVKHGQLGSFMEVPSAVATIDQPLTERIGTQIGPYKLLQQIGEGGFGVVYMAEQTEPVRRKVALKVIKPGMDTRQVIARFEAERQALAVMDHPNIARVFDAGATESGRPYFVMELVRGIPVTQYCDENNLPVRARLELFASVCQAIQHAHTKGIIHRDIKPTNVLVTRQDGHPAVKVIDFGVAKAMGQQLTEKTLFTEFAQLIGTPLYMSPEQAELSGVDIDTRSDIYSLGVLLYELLTGSTPVSKEQIKQAAFDEVRRIIREEDPPRPSNRISTTENAPNIAAHRHTEPTKLARLVRGELDWIVMKALEKDRSRRYETANGFAADVLHFLADEPVLACPPSTAYRFRKFARRNKAALATAAVASFVVLLAVVNLTVATAAVVVVALVLGIVVSTWQAVRAIKAENLAKSLLVNEKRATAKEAAARKDAERAYKDLIWNLLDAVRRPVQAEAICREQIALAERSVANSGGAPDELRRWGDLLLSLGWALSHQLRTAESAEVYRHNGVVYERLVAAPGSKPDDRNRLEHAYSNLGFSLKLLGRNDEAIAVHRQALALAERLAAEFPQEPKYLDRPAFSRWHLADLLVATGQLDEAERHYEQVLRFHESHTERNEFQDLRGVANLGLARIFYRRGQQDRAATTFEKVRKIELKSDHDNYNLAWLLANGDEPKFRDPPRAVELAKKAVELQPQERIYLIVLGAAQYRAGDWKAAKATLEKSTALGQGGDAFAWFFLAMAHWQLDQKEDARRWCGQAVEWMERNNKHNSDLRRFRAEAEELMMNESGVTDQESEGTQADS
jgi:serine/threonine protein kinase/tetratricopeptide (TPR) repeat protein